MTELLRELEAVAGLSDAAKHAALTLSAEEWESARDALNDSAVNFIRAHHAEIADALKDARRYRFIRDVPYAENIRLIMRDQCNGIMDKAIDAAIDAHLTQPAQSVDVRAIPDARPLPELMMASYHEAVGWNAYREALITRAIGNAQSVNVRNVVLKSLRHATTKVVELEVTEDGERIGIITFPASAVGRRYKMVRIDADLQEQAE